MEEYSIGSHKQANANFRPKPPPKPDSILKKIPTPTVNEFAESEKIVQKETKVKPPVLPKPGMINRRPEKENLLKVSSEEKATDSSQPVKPSKPVRKISATILALTDSMKLNEANTENEVVSSPKPLTKPGSLRKTSLFDTFNNTENIESTHIFNILPKSIQQPESSESKFPVDIPKVDYGDYEEISIPSPSTPKVKFALYPIDYNDNEKSNDMLDDQEWDNSDSDSFDSDTYDDVPDEKQESDIEVAQIIKTKHLTKNKLPSQMSTSTQLNHIVRELLENEESYCRSLQDGIKNYVIPFDRIVPSTLRGNKNHIFGNMVKISDFHEQQFLPSLRQCGDDLEKIAMIFKSYIQGNYFYCYVIYATNHKRAEKIVRSHLDFWRDVQDQCGDRLGINSFLLQPIQRLPRYLLLLNEIIKDLSKNLDSTFKETIAAFCSAEKDVKRLLETVNNSMSINDIKKCNEIDIMCQGRFKKMDEFIIFEKITFRRYRGKAYLFENCIIYTEAIRPDVMEYRGHFHSDKVFLDYVEGDMKFKLSYETRNIKAVKFKASQNIILIWTSFIMEMLNKYALQELAEKQRIAADVIRKQSMKNVRPTYVIRSDGLNRVTRSNTLNSRGSSGIASLDRDSYESNRSMDESSTSF